MKALRAGSSPVRHPIYTRARSSTGQSTGLRNLTRGFESLRAYQRKKMEDQRPESSAVEQVPYKDTAGGSNPSRGTDAIKALTLTEAVLLWKERAENVECT